MLYEVIWLSTKINHWRGRWNVEAASFTKEENETKTKKRRSSRQEGKVSFHFLWILFYLLLSFCFDKHHYKLFRRQKKKVRLKQILLVHLSRASDKIPKWLIRIQMGKNCCRYMFLLQAMTPAFLLLQLSTSFIVSLSGDHNPLSWMWLYIGGTAKISYFLNVFSLLLL